MLFIFFFFKQKTAYEMRISDWSSDVCSSDLAATAGRSRLNPFASCLSRMTCAWRESPSVTSTFPSSGRSTGAYKLKVLDLFSGIGGFSLGLERTGGFETVAFCEIEEFPRRVLKKHWPEVPCYHDVRELTADRLAADGIADIDVIAGGFPCQDISIAGRGLGLSGERSGLFAEVARLVGELRPQFVLLENVAELLSRGLGDVLGALASLGYDAEWDCIPAAIIGSPHIRDRAWILAYPNKGRRRANTAAGNNAHGHNTCRTEADGIVGAIPRPSSEWYLADPDAAHDYSERRRQYYGSALEIGRAHV